MCQLWRQKSNPGLHIIQTVSHAKQKEVMRTFKTEKLKSCSSVRLRASAPLWSSVYPQHSSVRRLHSLEAPSDIWSRLKWHRNTPWKTRRLARRDFVPRQQKIVWCVKRLQLKEKKKKKSPEALQLKLQLRDFFLTWKRVRDKWDRWVNSSDRLLSFNLPEERADIRKHAWTHFLAFVTPAVPSRVSKYEASRVSSVRDDWGPERKRSNSNLQMIATRGYSMNTDGNVFFFPTVSNWNWQIYLVHELKKKRLTNNL